MSKNPPGWYRDPSEPTTQRYWDGGGWLGDPLPVDATPPDGPPTVSAPVAIAPIPTLVPDAFQPPTPYPPTQYPPAQYPPAQYPPGMFPPGPAQPGTSAYQPPGMYPQGHPYPMTGPYVLRVAPRPHGLALAPLGQRFLARLIDIAAVLVLNLIVTSYLIYLWIQETAPYWRAAWQDSQTGTISGGPTMSSRGSQLLWVITLLIMATWAAYEVPAIGNSGQTLGKRIMGIQVIPLEGIHRLGYWRAFRRWTTLGLPVLLWTCLIGFVFQFIDCLSPLINRPLRMALHDRSAGTVCVVAPSAEAVAAANHPDRTTNGGTR